MAVLVPDLRRTWRMVRGSPARSRQVRRDVGRFELFSERLSAEVADFRGSVHQPKRTSVRLRRDDRVSHIIRGMAEVRMAACIPADLIEVLFTAG